MKISSAGSRLIHSAFAALLVGCSSTKRESAPTTVTAPNAPTPSRLQAQASHILPPGAATAPLPFEGEGWLPMFEGQSLAGWKLTEFSGHGEVSLESGVLLFHMGDPFTGLNWTNIFPKIDYEIALDAMRVSGSDFFCGLTVPVGDSFCSLIVGGWGGSLVGISSLDGGDASENETTKFESFQNGRWYRIRLRITQNRIEAWIDADKVVDVVTKGKTISLRPGEIELSKPLGVSSWQTAAALRQIRYREVSGPDSPTKPRL